MKVEKTEANDVTITMTVEEANQLRHAMQMFLIVMSRQTKEDINVIASRFEMDAEAVESITCLVFAGLHDRNLNAPKE